MVIYIVNIQSINLLRREQRIKICGYSKREPNDDVIISALCIYSLHMYYYIVCMYVCCIPLLDFNEIVHLRKHAAGTKNSLFLSAGSILGSLFKEILYFIFNFVGFH